MATETIKRAAGAFRKNPQPDTGRAVLEAIERSGSVPEGATPEKVASAVLCTLARRLSGGESRQLAGTLPVELRAMLEPCVVHKEEITETFDRAGFLDAVSSHFETPPDDPEELARVVFRLIHYQISRKQIADVASQLPADLKPLWREP
jgi:uncharacterized protein (DUF2267 family)